MATQPDQGQAHPLAKKYIRYGSSPRGAQSLVECGRVLAMMKGRAHLSIDDISQVAPSVLRHRVILNFDAHADGHTAETILPEILKGVASQAAATR
jgi:MoxR-like ATPase